jgi:ABC-type sugar transport system permease subunit
LFLLPSLAIIAVLVLYPLIISVYDSFHMDNLENPSHAFVGGRNYVQVFSSPAFHTAALNSLFYFALASAGSLIVGMVMAAWLHGIRRFRMLFLTIVVVPWAIPGVVNGILWSFIYNPTNGLLNAVLLDLHVIHHSVIWLESSTSAIVCISISLIWQIAPICAVIFLAGMESIPPVLYEQAAVDGSSGVRTFRSVTLPLLRPALAIGLLNAGILGLSIFDQVYVLSGYAPASISAVIQIYLYAFQDFQFGIGIAASMIVTVAGLLLSLFYLKVVYREVAY